MIFHILIHLVIFLIFSSSTYSQQLQWILLSDGTSLDTPSGRRDAALGFDQMFLILFGGRDKSGIPLQDTFSFNILTGQWDTLTFPAPPSNRYGMASTSSPYSGLYIFGGFGLQSSSVNNNPYTSFGNAQQSPNYNYATPPNFMQNPILMNNPDFINNPNYNPLSGTGYNNPNKFNDDDDRIDENYYPLQDAWFLSYLTKTWQQTQSTQYARGFGSATISNSMSDMPKIIYSMGKSQDYLYSVVEVIGRGASGLSQTGTTQASLIMYDVPSYSPAYPHARYGHSTALLTDNNLLLYGGCLSGYAKGGPCPSKDSWLLTIDRGEWERLGECPTTKTGAAMVTIPSYESCSGGSPSGAASVTFGNNQAIAVLWGGREFNPSSIRTYPSPRDEVAVFSLDKKEWFLKRAAPSLTDGSYPMQREGSAFVAGCFQGAPGMFVFGGRATADRRLLSDLWFLQVSPQDVLNAPGTRGCIYPFSFYHLHGIFQFFAYGILFPIGYLVGRHGGSFAAKRSLHLILQLFGIVLGICGFAFGIHSVRTPPWLHFRHAHGIIGIITFILMIIQFVVGLIGAICFKRNSKNGERLEDSDFKINKRGVASDTWTSDGAWRIIHRFLGAIVLLLGLINISLGIFLAVLPLPVWVVWYIYMGILLILLVLLEIKICITGGGSKKDGSLKTLERREDPKSVSQNSLRYAEIRNNDNSSSMQMPVSRRNSNRLSTNGALQRDHNLRRNFGENGSSIGDDRSPLITYPNQEPYARPDEVSASASLPEYNRSEEKKYPVGKQNRSRSDESRDIGYYVGLSPEHEQQLPRSTLQQQSDHKHTRITLK